MSVFGLWVYLSTTPLFWLTITLLVWLVADGLARLSGRNPLVNPVMISVAIVGTLLVGSGTRYPDYFAGAQFIHFLLGPATVALGLPLYRNRALVARNILPMAAALLAGAVVAMASALAIAASLGAPHDVLASLAPKSVTAAVAMAVAERLGGQPSLTAALVIMTGIIGAVMVTAADERAGHPQLRGPGLRGRPRGAWHRHGARLHGRQCRGHLRGIAMGLNAVVTAVLAPVVLAWF